MMFGKLIKAIDKLREAVEENNRLLGGKKKPLTIDNAESVLGGMFDSPKLVVLYRNKKYILTRLNKDISAEFFKPEGTIILSHKIEGFEEPLYMVIDTVENNFSFATKIAETGLYVSLMDDKLHEEAVDFVSFVEKLNDIKGDVQ